MSRRTSRSAVPNAGYRAVDIARMALRERCDLATGLVAMWTGGGMGTATIIERG